MCFNKTIDSFCEMIMEIKITAVKQKLSYTQTDSTLGANFKEEQERLVPFLELMMKELQNNQMKNQQRSIKL